MPKNNDWLNEDTYQTIKEVNVSPQDPSKPIWFEKKEETKTDKKQIKLCVGTPVHSEVSIHYAQCLLEIQKEFMTNEDKVSFLMHKSSLVTQGRNLTVASFLETSADYLLFLDSDIGINPEVIYKMIKTDKDVVCVPYPLKSLQWGKMFERFQKGKIKTADDLETAACTYPIRLKDQTEISLNKDGTVEIESAPAGCLLIKRSVFKTLIKKYPDRKIKQKSVINGKLEEKKHYYNFFDTIHDKETQTYMGEDYGFCKLWTDLGYKVHALVTEYIMHVGEHQYIGRFVDEFEKTN